MPWKVILRGPAGCGKTSLARALEKKFSCNVRDEHIDNTLHVGTWKEISAANTPLLAEDRGEYVAYVVMPNVPVERVVEPTFDRLAALPSA